MKKLLCLILGGAMLFSLVACTGRTAADTPPEKPAETDTETPQAAAYRIGIVTDTRAQGEDDWYGAEAVRERYGDDMVTHVTYPDDFADERFEVIQTITSLADDPEIKAIIVNQAIPGTADAFSRVKKERPDVLCLAGEPHEEAAEICAAADLVSDSNFIARGYLMIRNAHELGCDTFVHISFPRHMGYETIARRARIMEAACAEFGMTFAQEEALDPGGDSGITGAQAYIMDNFPAWHERYGDKAAYFCTSDGLTWPLIRQVLDYGGYMIEQDSASPMMGYPEALNLDVNTTGVDFEAILHQVEAGVVAQGGAGRFGTWPYSYGYITSAGLAQHAINVIEGKSELLDLGAIAEAFKVFSPGAGWNISAYVNAETDTPFPNGVLVYEDTYIMGDPGHAMGGTAIEIPETYFKLK